MKRADYYDRSASLTLNQSANSFLHHKEVYANYILPRVGQPRYDWDNHAENDQGPVHSLDACRVICESLDTCVQYSLSNEMRCQTTDRPNLGEWSRGVDSGWVYERMKKFYNEAEACHGERWITQ